ncbi:TraB/GumN family protein [Erythrobacter colymbi]|uniref:TraB/GumN family protein n=1 Tax=Erythrobacter colymbi TaxID=1161202 RepID=UPI0013902726|nr:TraB/GumN family protein [Erythrobacter colymbi]
MAARGTTAAGAVRSAARVIAPLLLALLAACSDAPGETSADLPPASPLLYEIASADGTVEGWMFGTIHALPSGAKWRTPEVGRSIDAADFLVVEIAALGDDAALGQTYAALSTSPALPPITARVPPELTGQLSGLLARGGYSQDSFATTETWAAALALARIDATGDPANGVDRALIADFKGRPVREFEGAAAQLGIFDTLPEAQQRAMLAAVVHDSETARRDPARLQRAWMAGDAATIAASTREGILADPALHEALLAARNRRWAAMLVPMLKQSPRPLVAVGTAHLVGPEGLAALLEAQGYRIRRLSPPEAAPATPAP